MGKIDIHGLDIEAIKSFKKSWIQAGYPIELRKIGDDLVVLTVQLSPRVFDGKKVIANKSEIDYFCHYDGRIKQYKSDNFGTIYTD